MDRRTALTALTAAAIFFLPACKGQHGLGSPDGYQFRIGQVIYWVGPNRPAEHKWEPSGKNPEGEMIWKRPVTPEDRKE